MVLVQHVLKRFTSFFFSRKAVCIVWALEFQDLVAVVAYTSFHDVFMFKIIFEVYSVQYCTFHSRFTDSGLIGLG